MRETYLTSGETRGPLVPALVVLNCAVVAVDVRKAAGDDDGRGGVILERLEARATTDADAYIIQRQGLQWEEEEEEEE